MLPPHGVWVTEAIPGEVEGLKSAATSRSLGNRGYAASCASVRDSVTESKELVRRSII